MKKLLFTLAIFFSGAIISCSEESYESPITYEVQCSPEGFDVIYEDYNGSRYEETITDGYWSMSFTGIEGEPLYLSAQSHNENATITVSIHAARKTLATETNTGDYASATVSDKV